MADTSVNLYHWQMVGAPTVSGAAGGLIAMLDAVLINGFGSKTLDSLTVSGGVATATVASGHSAIVDGVQLIAGITGTYAALNGKQKITAVTSTTFQFDATGHANGSAAGTVTTKVAPLGYTKPYSGTNKAAYLSSDVASLGMYLRVDDSATLNAAVRGYESMSDVDTGTGLFAASSNGFWPKSSSADSTARPWFVIGDSRAFFYWCEPNTGVSSGVTSQAILTYFGDIVPRRSSDAYATMLSSNTVSYVNQTAVQPTDMGTIASSAGESFKCPRGQEGIGTQQTMGLWAASRKLVSSGTTGSGNGAQFYPNAADNGLDFDEVVLSDQINNSIRGRVPGLYHLPQNVEFSFITFDTIAGAGDLNGKKLLFMRVANPGHTTQHSTSSRYGVVAFDLTGPWR